MALRIKMMKYMKSMFHSKPLHKIICFFKIQYIYNRNNKKNNKNRIEE